MTSQECPICGKMANYGHPPDMSDQFKCFECPLCGCFVITLMAEEHLNKFSLKDRMYYSEKSQAAEEGKVLIIQFLDDGSQAVTIHRYDEKREWFG